MRKGESSTGTDYFISNDYGMSFETVPHVIPYQSGGYSNSMTFSPDGKLLYVINCPNDPNSSKKNKISFALVELIEGALTLPENQVGYTN